MEENQILALLTPVNQLLEHQGEMMIAKGENFNLFSILKMERLENNTHSNFIAALLNPKGTHAKGTIFLELFLDMINQRDFIDLKSGKPPLVFVEYALAGVVDCEKKTGGRIDIFIQDDKGNSISIENKIDAIDQPCQIERYCNYNNSSNKVFYLTLDGKSASEGSAGKLIPGKDYYTISYSETIIDWLLLCQKEAVDHAILRENIRQYILLIQKITNTMDKKYEGQLIKLLLSNYTSAKFISSNLDAALIELFEEIRAAIIDSINVKLKGQNYFAVQGSNIKTSNAQIWIKHKSELDRKIYFGIEPFGLSASYQVFTGIFYNEDLGFDKFKDVKKHNNYWSNVQNIEPIENISIHFGEEEFISKIGVESSFKMKVIEGVSNKFITYFNEQKGLIESFLKINS